MKSRDFCYWLQGWFELNKTIDHRGGASKEALEVIEKHLAMVFIHEIDPSFPAYQQGQLDAAHGIKHPAEAAFGPGGFTPGSPVLRC